jgi:hypothetical protein
MIKYKSKLCYVVNAIVKEQNLYLELNNGLKFNIENYLGPQFNVGRLIIYSVNSYSKITSLYLLDSNKKPFQIFGEFDVLDVGCVVYDYTKDNIRNISYANQICFFTFSNLTIENIENYKNELKTFETETVRSLLNSNLGWKSAKKKISDLCSSWIDDIHLIEQIRDLIKITPMPKNLVHKFNEVNLDGYEFSVFVKY